MRFDNIIGRSGKSRHLPIHKSKLSPEQVNQIRDALKNGESTVELAKQFNVSPSTISNIRYNRIWRHITYKSQSHQES